MINTTFGYLYNNTGASQVMLVVKNPPDGFFRDAVSIPGSGRSPGEEHGNPLQYSCLKNPHRERGLAGYPGLSIEYQRVIHDLSDLARMHV